MAAIKTPLRIFPKNPPPYRGNGNFGNSLTPSDIPAFPKKQVSGFSGKSLPARVQAMATRWNYSPDETAAALTDAARNPADWLAVVTADEAQGITAADFPKTETRPNPKTEEPNPSHSMEYETMLTVSAESSGAFEMCPAGPVAARCNRLVDLGTQQSEYQGETKSQRKLLISWELAETRADGDPFTISRRFGLSLHEKSALRSFLQAWRGRPFTDEELAGFDLRKLLNAPCLLNITHTNRNGKDYANIASVTPLPKGMSAPDLTNKPVVFDIDAADAVAVLEALSDSLVATIEASPEWQAKVKELGAGGDFDPSGLDDVAF